MASKCISTALVTLFTRCAILAPWHCIPTAMDTEDTMSPMKCHWHHAGVSWRITAHTKHPIAGHDMAIPAMRYNCVSVKSDVSVCGISTPCKAMHWAGVIKCTMIRCVQPPTACCQCRNQPIIMYHSAIHIL